ncbi:MAG: YceI family protein [Sphingomonadales bacterium]
MLGKIGPLFALAGVLTVGGCTTILPMVVPSHNQTVDTSAIRSGHYVLDPAHGSVHFRVDHMGYSTYVARFNDIDAQFDFDNTRPELSTLIISIRADSVDSGNKKMDELIAGRDFLNARRYPDILFRADGVTILDERTGIINGTLTFHGVTRPLSLQLTFRGGARNFLTGKYTLGFSATASLRRSDYNMGAYIPLVSDEVKIQVEAEFQLQK